MAEQAILVIDQGTTSSRAIVFDQKSRIVAMSQQEFTQHFPHEGWVEHDPEEIWATSLATARNAFSEAENNDYEVIAIGITNQRETTIVWDRDTGKPIYNAIVWQDRRTADRCRKLAAGGHEEQIQQTTGLLLDPYFSASKIAWILDNVQGARKKAEEGALAFGTVDSFLINRLTDGVSHLTDATNASRTSLYNIIRNEWDDALLSLFNVPRALLPEVLDSAADFGHTAPEIFGRPIPICGVAGDQQAATIGQCCFDEGDVKSTYGTGCFMLLNTGSSCVLSQNRLLTTIAYKLHDKTVYALEGSIFMAGASIQWLRDNIRIISNAAETEELVKKADTESLVTIVPAFTGLGAPHWNADARASVFGMSRATGRPEIVRAMLEAVCYQTADLLQAMTQDGARICSLKVDGGMVANDWLLSYLSSLLNVSVKRPEVMETTALGAAYLAGLQVGLYDSLDVIKAQWQKDQEFEPEKDNEHIIQKYKKWQEAVALTKVFGEK